jgi:hypothetical protein
VNERPVYVGIGECDCKRVDVLLYHVPGTALALRPVCAFCLTDKGYTIPEPRTADDLEEIDGRPTWKPTTPTPSQETVEARASVDQLNLGHGHFFAAVIGADEHLVGWLHTHPDARSTTGVLCQSFCAVRPLNGSPVHQIVSVEPLTLLPSLLCRMCGAHGHVTNGKWEPC